MRKNGNFLFFPEFLMAIGDGKKEKEKNGVRSTFFFSLFPNGATLARNEENSGRNGNDRE
jgi:hypothetical protein